MTDADTGSGLPQQLQSLLDSGSYPHPVSGVELVQTHISWVLLTGDFAYKIKRPVHQPFIDLRCPERRAFLCHEEVRLNRRFAPELYLDVCPITSVDGRARMAGDGPVIEHAVKLRQFRAADELDRLLEAGRIEPGELETFGRDLAHLHDSVPISRCTQAWGRPDAVCDLIARNLEDCGRAAVIFDRRADVQAMYATLQTHISAAAAVMSKRFFGGRVRECHADLHCKNIVRWGSRLLAFDCLEFEPAFRWIDVADEIAFLLADLASRHFPQHAQAFLGAYLAQSGDYECCRVLPLYRAHRSLVRAKIIALSAADAPDNATDSGASSRRQFQDYLHSAQQSLAPKRAVLILMSGLSGSGKSWIAQRLAAQLEAVHVRSDIERKRLLGLSEQASSGSELEQGLYSGGVSARVYQHLARCAEDILAGGYTAIVDAAFNRREDRVHFHELAVRLNVDACIVHCHAPLEVLQRRVAARARLMHDPSEANLSVLHWQCTHREPIAVTEALPVLEATTTDEDVIGPLLRRIAAMQH